MLNCHPALIHDNVEKDYPHYTPKHCNFIAVFAFGMPDFVVSPHTVLISDGLALYSQPQTLSGTHIDKVFRRPLLPPGYPWRANFLKAQKNT